MGSRRTRAQRPSHPAHDHRCAVVGRERSGHLQSGGDAQRTHRLHHQQRSGRVHDSIQNTDSRTVCRTVVRRSLRRQGDVFRQRTAARAESARCRRRRLQTRKSLSHRARLSQSRRGTECASIDRGADQARRGSRHPHDRDRSGPRRERKRRDRSRRSDGKRSDADSLSQACR